MKTLKGWITTLVLAMTLLASTAFADGVIIGGRGNTQPCTPPVKASIDFGTVIGGVASQILANLTGIIIGGKDGVIIGGKDGVIIGGKDVPVVNCGIIIGG
jgi:hypothetical protein